MFLWVDLRRYLTRGVAAANLSVHRSAPEDLEEYRRRELELGARFLAAGVGVGVGSSFCTEEVGWFRLTFSVSSEALETALQRMLKVLREVELESGGTGEKKVLVLRL